jgi:predicted DNA-binding transcriptional regulator AlpA
MAPSIAERPTALPTPSGSANSNNSDALHELLTVEDVAALLRVSKTWVYEHTRSRGTPRAERLPHIRIGKYVRFDPGAIRVFLDKKTCQPK